MSFVDPLVNLFGPRCLDSIQQQFEYLIKVKWHVEHVTQALVRLKARRDDVQLRVDEAERSQGIRTNEVANWLQEVADIEANVRRIQERYQQRCLCFGCCGLNCWSNYRIGKGAFKKLSKVEKLIADGRDFQDVAAQPPPAVAVEVRNPPNVLGMESNLQKVLGYLDGGEAIIGIWGMGGVGKSTLLGRVNNAFLSGQERSSQFHHVIWVVASRDLNLEKLQQDIAKKLKLTLEKDASMEERADSIYCNMKNKNFLLLLDDLWKYVDLNEVGIPHPGGGGDQHKHRVVLTTRSEAVCGAMEARTSLKVQCLEWEEAWQLFKEKVGEGTINSDPSIPALAETVARECRGLPLALITIGRAMSSKRKPQDWNHAIRKLQSSHHSEISGMEDEEMLNKLKFSYDRLTDDKTRHCFLCCSLWPEDYAIRIDSLVECWMGLGLIDEPGEIDNTYNKGHYLITVLKEACLLEPGGNEDREVKMHDVIRDMALWIASECGKKPNKWLVQADVGLSEASELAEQWTRAEEAERMSLMDNYHLKMLPQQLPAQPKLTTLMLQDNQNLEGIPHSFFPCRPALTYLDLSNTNIKELPTAIGTLGGLQYLNLSKTSIKKLPEELGSLKELKYLLLEGTIELSEIPCGVISSLQNLQVLDLYKSRYADWEVEQGGSLDELRSLLFLKALGITVRSVSWRQKISMLPPGVSARRLCIRELPAPEFLELRPSTFSALLGSLMQSLRELMILNCSTLTVLTVKDGVSLPNLENLDLFRFTQLEVINLKREVAAKALPTLRSLRIWICHLKSISWVLQLPCLKELQLSHCWVMEEVIGDEVRIEDAELAFPRLRTLLLDGLESLTSISRSVLAFPSLEIITVIDCPNLKKLPIGSQIIGNKLREIWGSEEWWNGLVWEGDTKSSLLPYFINL